MARSFYEDDDQVVTTPGVNAPIPSDLKQEEALHGDFSYFKGMVIRTAPTFEKYTKQARTWLHDKLQILDAELETQRLSANNEWRNVKAEVADTIRDPLLPNGILILTATLTGSILVNRRLLPVRFAAPVLVGTAATAFFMPNTFHQLTAKYDAVEAAKAPEFHQQKQEFIHNNIDTLELELSRGLRYANAALQLQVHEARMAVANLLGSSESK